MAATDEPGDERPDLTADRTDRYARTVLAACGTPADRLDGGAIRAAARELYDARDLRAGVRALTLLDGPRRAAAVLVVAAALLLGAAPIDSPPASVVVLLAAGVAGTSIATWWMSGRAVRPGDRLVWSYASIGQALSRGGDVVAAQWAGVVASIIAVNVSISLRGVSDRWTHGLAAMDPDARVTTMVVGLVLVAGGFVCLTVLAPPEPSPDSVPRRLEERSARRTALGATLAVAIVGLVAGVLTGTVEAESRIDGGIDDEPGRLEAPTDADAVGMTIVGRVDPDPADVGDPLVGRAQVAAQRSDHP
jgi:hypothetical protein